VRSPAVPAALTLATHAFDRMLVRLRAIDHFATGRRVLTLLALAHMSPLVGVVLSGLQHSEHDAGAMAALRRYLADGAAEIEVERPDLRAVLSGTLVPDVLQSNWEQSAAYASQVWRHLPKNVSTREFGAWTSERLDQIVAAGPAGSVVGTPRPLAAFMVRLAELHPGQSVYDPCCGLGGLLAESWRVADSPRLIGADVHPLSYAFTRLRLALLDAPADVVRRDILREPIGVIADRVLCDPPLGSYAAGEEALRPERPRSAGAGLRRYDALFLERALEATAPDGRAVVLVSHGLLSRRDQAEQELRRGLVGSGRLEAIIGLPAGAVPWTSVELAILVVSPAQPGRDVKVVDGNAVISGRYQRPQSSFASLTDAYFGGEPSPAIANLASEMLLEADSLVPRRLLSAPLETRRPAELLADANMLIDRANSRLPRIRQLFLETLDPDD